MKNYTDEKLQDLKIFLENCLNLKCHEAGLDVKTLVEGSDTYEAELANVNKEIERRQLIKEVEECKVKKPRSTKRRM